MDMSELLREIRSLRAEIAETRAAIGGTHVKIDATRDELAKINAHGCGKAWEHEDARERLADLERDVNRGKGIAAVFGAVSGAALGWIGSKL